MITFERENSAENLEKVSIVSSAWKRSYLGEREQPALPLI